MSGARGLRLSEKGIFGIGALGNGLVTGAVATLLLLFYNQAVGLDPALVGLALMISIICDALWDPLIGHWTDNTRTRWGRRHPFMYLSALPAAVSFYLLFSPPLGWSDSALFFYLLGTVMTLRFSISLFEIASNALIPELTPDYDDRTTMWSFWVFFGLAGGLTSITLAYQIFLPAGGGLTSPTGYSHYGLAAAIIIIVALMVSSLSVHRHIPNLIAPATEHWSFEDLWRDVSSVMRNHTFLVLLFSGLASGLSAGLTSSLALYFNAYFWELTPQQIALIQTGALLASMGGVMLAPMLSRRMGKKESMILLFWGSLAVSVIPIALRLIDVMPPNGSSWVFWILFADAIAGGVLGYMGIVIVVSLMTDVVEDIAAATGRRTEGQIFAFTGMLRKTVAGFGTFAAGLLLAFVAFPEKAIPGQVEPEVLRNLALIYLPITSGLVCVALALLSLLKVDRHHHAENLRKLEAAAAPPDAFTGTAGPVVAPQTLPEGPGVRL